jgi:hypothetical protein
MTVNELDPKSIILHGKYKGCTVQNIIHKDLKYICWAVANAPYIFKTTKPKPTTLKEAAQQDPVEPDDENISNHHTMDRIRQQMIQNGTFEF